MITPANLANSGIFYKTIGIVKTAILLVNVHRLSYPTINISTQTNIYLTFPFIYVILIVCYVSHLKKTQNCLQRKMKIEQPAGTINNQNPKFYTSRGNFFRSGKHEKKHL